MDGSRVVDASQLDLINEAIHDCWFELASVRHTADRALEIPFRIEGGQTESGLSGIVLSRPAGEPNAVLRIHHVASFDVVDSAKVGRYDFNRLLFDAVKSEIRVTTGIPLEFRIQVDRLEISCGDLVK